MAGIMDGFSEFTNAGVSAKKQAKLANTSQVKQEKLAPVNIEAPQRFPDSLTEFAAGKTLNLAEIAAYDEGYANQQAQDAQAREGFAIDDTSTTMGQLGNLGVQFGAGAVRTAAQIAAAPLEVAAQIAQVSVGDKKRAKLSGEPVVTEQPTSGRPNNGILGGTFSLNDVNLGQDVTTEGKQDFIDFVKEEVTPRKQAVIDKARSFVNTDKEKILLEQLGDGYDDALDSFESGDVATGAGKLFASGVGSILSNPAATLGFLAESLPQMLATTIRTPANVAYGISTAAAGVEKFEQDNGREATREEMLQIMAVSGSAAFAENFSAAKLLPKPVKKTASKVNEQASKAKEASKLAKTAKAVKKVGAGAVGEATTEGFQTAAEQVAGTLDVGAIEGKEVFTAAAIGGGIGGKIAAVSPAKDVLAKAQENVEAFKGKAAQKIVDAAEKARTSSPVKVQEAVNKGDVSGEGLTTAEHVEVLQDPKTFPAEQAEREKRIAEIDAQVDKLFDEAVELQDSDPDKATELLAQADTLAEKSTALGAITVGKPSATLATVEAIEDAPAGDVDATEGVKRIFNSMSTKPGSVTAAQARTISESEVVTPAEKVKLVQYAELEEALEAVTTTEVNNQVINGGKGNKGIKQYRTAFNAAIVNNDQQSAKKALAGLTSFANRHTAKVVAVTAAFQAVIAGSKEAPALVEKVQASYKLGISKGSNSGEVPLIDMMQSEAHALQKAVTQMSGKTFTAVPTETLTAQDSGPSTPKVVTPQPKAQHTPEVIKDVDSGIKRINELVKSLVQSKANVTSSLSKKIAVLDAETSTLAEVQSVLDITGKIAAFNGVQIKAPVVEETIESPTPNEVIADERISTEETTTGLREETEGTVDTPTGTEVNREVARNELRSRKLGVRHVVHTFTDVLKQGIRGTLAKSFKAKVNKNNALHQVKDFFNEYAKDERIVHDLTAGQVAGMRTMVKHDQAIRSSIRSLFVQVKGKHTIKEGRKGAGTTFPKLDLSKDMFQNLVGIDGKLDNNLLSTISVATANWIASDAKENVYNDDSAINSILGRPADTVVGPDARSTLREVGMSRAHLTESIGNEILGSIGFKANKDADGQLKGNLAVALGQMAVASMLDQGLVTENRVNSNKIAQLKDGDKAKLGDKKAYASFIRVAVQPNANGYMKIADNVDTIVDSLHKSEGVLTEVFGVTNFETGPSFTEPKHVVEDVKGTFQKVNEQVRGILKKHQARPHYAKQGALNVWGFLPEEVKRDILGYEDNMLANTHVYHHPTVIGVNNEIERSIGNVETFTVKMLAQKAGLAAKFFFSHEMWKNNRLGMISNTINLQGDKLHRHLFGMDAWNITIDPKDEAMMIQAKLAIAEGFGIKVDKNTITKTLAEYDKLVNTQVIRDAVKSIKVVNGKRAVQARTTDRHIDNIVAAIEMGGEKAYTLDALINLAKIDNEAPFEFDLFREVDGITNGVAIGTWQLGAADGEIDMERRLAKTGLYYVEGGKTYGEHNENPSNQDSYEDLSTAWEKAMGFFREAGPLQSRLTALDALIFGEGVAAAISRTMSKNPLMITNYGAAIKGVIDAFAEDQVGGLYKKIAKAKNQKELNVIAGRISAVTGTQMTFKFGEHLNKLMTPAQDKEFRSIIEQTYGAALTEALEAKYAMFTDSRTHVNTAVGVMFDAFNILYKGNLAKAETEADRVLSQDERQELVMGMYESVPLFHNYFSMKSGNRTEMTVGMKTNKVRQTDDKRFANIQKYAKPVAGAASDQSFSSMEEFEDAGVAPMILAIHGIDAATMVLMLDNQAGLNVHDAYAYGLDTVMEGTDQFNEGFGKVMRELDIAAEVQKSLTGNLKEFAKNATTKQKAELDKAMVKRKLGSTSKYVINGGAALTEIARRKAKVTGLVKEISQYHTEGGAHAVDQGNVKEALDEIVIDVEKDSRTVIKDMGIELKSSNAGIDTNNFHETYSENVNKRNVTRVFNDLGKVGNVKENAEHSRNLLGTLNTLVGKVMGPIALKMNDLAGKETHGVFTDGKIFISNSIGSIENGIQMSTQETYVHELVHSVTAAEVDGSSFAARELKKLFNTAEKVIKPEDFLNPGTHIGSANYATELEAAQARYDHIFNNTGVDGSDRNAYLHEFVALGLTNENFMRALANVPGITVNRNPQTVWEGVRALFTFILDATTSKITQTGRLKADAKLRALAEQLAGIDHRNKSVIYSAYDRAATFATKAGNKLVTAAVAPLKKFVNSQAIKRSKFTAVRAAGKLARTLPIATWEDYNKVMKRVLGNIKGMRDGFLAQLSTEMQGRTKVNGYMHTLGRYSNKMIDQVRLDTQTKATAHLASMFTTELNTRRKVSLGRSLLKTDAVALLDNGYTLQQVQELIADASKLKAEITKQEAQLTVYGNNQHFYRKQAENMGLMMATGISREHLTLRNAKNIAELMDTNGQVVGDLVQAEKLIDILGTLHAIKFTEVADRNIAGKVIKDELAVGEQNGVDFMLKEHRFIKQDAKERNFEGNERLIVKGHTKEIMSPDVTVMTATDAEMPELLKQGWKLVKKLEHDSAHPLAGEALNQIVNNGGLLAKYNSGVTSLTSEKANGADLVKVRGQVGDVDFNTIQNDANTIFNAKAQKIADMFGAADTRTPPSETILVQLHDGQGNLKGYRYMMTEKNKVELLKKDDSFDAVLGHMAASVTDKVNTTDINNRVVNALYEDFNENFAEDSKEFVTVGPTGKYAEIWNMLPADMKAEVKLVWGGTEMAVRQNMIRLVFGERKASVSQLLRKEHAENDKALETVNKTFNNGLVKLFNNPAARTIEKVWMEVVSAVKDAIVIKTISVTAGNIGSNMILLRTLGVSNKDMVRDHAIAIRGAIDMKRQQTELDRLQRNVRNDVRTPKDKARIARLKTEIKNNPIFDLFEEGIYQSIVEDIDLVDNQFSKLGMIETAAKPITDALPGFIKKAGSEVFMTHEAKSYQFLRESAQLSDFVARFVLHKHNIANKKMTKEESLNRIVDVFINYDLPTHKAIQYANDMGFVMFTKFFIRIQKIIFLIMKENPASVLGVILAQKWMGDVSDIMDSNMLTQNYGGKLNTAPLSLVGSIADIPTLNVIK